MVRLSKRTDVGVEWKFLVVMSLKNKDFVCGVCRRQLEGLDGPFKNTFDSCRRAKRFVMLPIVENRHLDFAAAMAVDMMAMTDFAFGKLPMTLDRFVAILGENEDFFINLTFEAARGDDDFKEFCYRGLLTRLNELRIHAVE